MGCACNAGKASATAKPKSFLYTSPQGKKTAYRTEVEAAAAKARSGGSYKAVA